MKKYNGIYFLDCISLVSDRTLTYSYYKDMMNMKDCVKICLDAIDWEKIVSSNESFIPYTDFIKQIRQIKKDCVEEMSEYGMRRGKDYHIQTNIPVNWLSWRRTPDDCDFINFFGYLNGEYNKDYDEMFDRLKVNIGEIYRSSKENYDFFKNNKLSSYVDIDKVIGAFAFINIIIPSADCHVLNDFNPEKRYSYSYGKDIRYIPSYRVVKSGLIPIFYINLGKRIVNLI